MQLIHIQRSSHDVTQTSSTNPSLVIYVNIGFTNSGQRDYIARLPAILSKSLHGMAHGYSFTDTVFDGQETTSYRTLLQITELSPVMTTCNFSHTTLHLNFIYIVVIKCQRLVKTVNSLLYRMHDGISAQRLSHILCEHHHTPLPKHNTRPAATNQL